MLSHRKKIIPRILIVMLTAVIGLAVWQKENLRIFYMALTKDSHSISQIISEAQQSQNERLEQDFNITVQSPTADQTTDLLDGKTTSEEVKVVLGLVPPSEEPALSEKSPAPSPSSSVEPPSEPPTANPSEPPVKKQESPAPELPVEQPPKPEDPKPLTEEERKSQIEHLLNQCVTELYAYEVDLMAEMSEIKRVARKDWRARPYYEKTRDKKIEFGFMWLEEVYVIEARADLTVQEILSRYRSSLEELDADTSPLDDMWKYYCDKKSNTKAYYLNKYLN